MVGEQNFGEMSGINRSIWNTPSQICSYYAVTQRQRSMTAGHHWVRNLSLRRLLNDWEVERVANLSRWNKGIPGTNSDPDSLRWLHSAHGAFTISRACTMETNEHSSSQQSLWGKVWRNLAPNKVKCFTWLTPRRACLTHEVLKKKGMTILSWSSLYG